jgi:phospholipase C
MTSSKFLYATTVFLSASVAVGLSQSLTVKPDSDSLRSDKIAKIDHIVVIYQENHSFDNLYGDWEGVNGRASAESAHKVQVGQGGNPYTCLPQNDVSLTSPPLPADCSDPTTGAMFTSHFPNSPFQIDAFIPVTAQTCPKPADGTSALPPSPNNLPGGCTRDLAHRFYQELYQLDGGRQDRYVTGSDAAGLTMGYYDMHA